MNDEEKVIAHETEKNNENSEIKIKTIITTEKDNEDNIGSKLINKMKIAAGIGVAAGIAAIFISLKKKN